MKRMVKKFDYGFFVTFKVGFCLSTPYSFSILTHMGDLQSVFAFSKE